MNSGGKYFIRLTAAALALAVSAVGGDYFPASAEEISEAGIYDTTPGDCIFKVECGEISPDVAPFDDDFFLPFDAKNVVFSYTAENDVQITLKINGEEYVLPLSQGSGECEIDLSPVLRSGDVSLSLSANGAVKITEITFNKVNITWKAPFMRTLPDITEFEQDIATAVILRKGSTAMFVNGSRRYIDYDDTDSVPRSINGNIYIPVKTLARAIGTYYEDYPELTYVLMRSENTEIKANGRDCTVKNENAADIQCANPFVYINGAAYAPVRKISEIFGKYVIYQNGTVIIENSRIRAEAIAQNSEYMTELNTVLDGFSEKNEGTTYYVAQTVSASDNNAGTKNAPFETLAKACEVAKAGDTVIIGGGIYRETLAPQNSGTAGAPIVFRAAENEDVTVSAFEKLSGFTDVTENDEFYNADVKLCCAETDIDLGYTRNFILYSGSEIIQGRYPNVQTNTAAYEWPEDVTGVLWPTKGNIKVKSNECDTPTSADYRVYTSGTDLQQDDNYWQGATFIGEVEGGWALTSGKILWSTEGKFKLDNTTVSFNWSSFGKTYGAFSSDYGYITDSIKTIDVPGEWQIETIGEDENKKSFLYICPPEGETAESLEVEIKARQNVINLKNSKFVNIENINTSGGGVCMDNSEMCVINGGNMKYLSHFIANKDASQCFLDGTMNDWTTESDNYITRGELGICIGGTDCAVVNATIDCSAAAGILLYGKYAYIENNTIRDTGYAGAYFAGIFCTSEAYEPKETARGGYYIYNNTVKNTGRASFCMTTMMYKTQTDEDYKTYGLNAGRESDRGQFLPCEIAYNYFYNSNLIARDTGAYYIHGNNSGNDSTFTKLHNNVVCNVQGNDNFESGFQPFACESYFYNDAWVAGINEYDNVGFATNGKQSYTYTEPFVGGSDYEEMYAAANNIDAGIVPIGIDGLTAAQYPSGKPFAAGVRDSNNRFMLNYGGTWADVYEYGTDDAVLSDNAERNGAEVKLEADGYAEFKNVVLNNKTNRLAIYYKGDRYDYAELKVLVGETEYSAKANCRGYDNTYECICYLDVKEVGTYDVKITKIDGGEFVLCGLNVIEDPICRVDTRNYIIGGEFKTESSGPQRNIRRNKNLTAAHNYSYAWNLQHNPTLVYENVETDAYDSIEISVQCPSDYPDIGLELYKDSPDGTPIATLKFTGTTWSEYQTYRCKLQSAEDGGTHTYYVKVIGTGTYNLYHIRFFNEETVEETYEPNIREVNFAVNAKLSGDGEFSRALYKMVDNSDETDAACSDGTYVQLDIGKQISPSRSELLLKFRIEGYTLQGSNDGTAFTDIAKIEKSDAVLVSGDGKNETADIYRWSKKFDGNGAGYRYYRITGSRQGVMNIHDVKLFAEVEESAPGYREVNLFEEITPTCTVSDGASIVEHQGMERLYDGDLEKAAAIEKCEYVLLDLGDTYDVTALKFVYQGRNNNGYKISASADGENYDTLYFAPNVTSYTTQYSNKIYTDKKKYRYIRIDSIGADNQIVQSGLYLIELSVYGLISNR